MSYEKQTWADGQTITASKLNHMENGIFGAGGMPSTADAQIGYVLILGENKAPVWAPVSAVRDDYVVTFSIENAAIVADKFIANIYAAKTSGKNIYAQLELAPGVIQYFIVSEIVQSESITQVDFYAVQVGEDGAESIPHPVCIRGENAGADDGWSIIDE